MTNDATRSLLYSRAIRCLRTSRLLFRPASFALRLHPAISFTVLTASCTFVPSTPYSCPRLHLHLLDIAACLHLANAARYLSSTNFSPFPLHRTASHFCSRLPPTQQPFAHGDINAIMPFVWPVVWHFIVFVSYYPVIGQPYPKRPCLGANPLSVTYEHTPPRPRLEMETAVRQTLDGYRPKMKELVVSAPSISSLIPSWSLQGRAHPANKDLEHIRQLAIPCVNEAPDLLLHHLGEERNEQDRQRMERIPDIFSFPPHRSVCTS